MMQAVEGSPPASAQKGLKSTLRAQGYFMACVCKPEGDLEIAYAEDGAHRTMGTVVDVSALSSTVARLLIATDDSLDYHSGQFVNLVLPDRLSRSYSLASVSGLDTFLEFHIAYVPHGRMSGWVHEEARAGDRLEIHGPLGDCYYLPDQPEQPLFLLGTGTGLAPLYGIARDALEQGHTGPIHLFHGGLSREYLYLVEELRELDRHHGLFRYHPCTFEGDAEHDIQLGYIDDVALKEFDTLAGWRIFLCGDPQRVRRMQRKTFLAGASLDDIYSDSFVPSV